MPEIRIKDTPAAADLADTDFVIVDRESGSGKVAIADLRALVGGLPSEYAAAAAPTVDDDEGDGYTVGSLWVWPDNPGGLWICVDATAGAAQWALVSTLADPTVRSIADVTAQPGAYTLRTNDLVVQGTPSTTYVQIDLSGSIFAGRGALVLVRKLGAVDQPIVLNPTSGDTVEGGATYNLDSGTSAGAWWVFRQSNGDWRVLEHGAGGVADHGALTGLGDDDHLQYLRVDGSRTADSLTTTGTIDVGDELLVAGLATISGGLVVDGGSVDFSGIDVSIGGAQVKTQGAPTFKVERKTASFNAASGIAVYLVDTSGGAVTITLPAVVDGIRWVIKKIAGSNKITLARTGADNIEGANASYDLPGSATSELAAYEVVGSTQASATGWWVL